MRHAFRADGDDVLEVIDEEVARLPEQYRGAVVLCDLEGRSYAEAARRLRCPLGTLQSRLARGRARLRTRLVRRAVAPFAVTAILAGSARAAVPDALADGNHPGGDCRCCLGFRRRAGRFYCAGPGHVHGQDCRRSVDSGRVTAGRGPGGARSASRRAAWARTYPRPAAGAELPSRPGPAARSSWRWSTPPIVHPWPARRS